METERQRKAKKVIEAIEGLRLACKQFDIFALDYENVILEDLRGGDIHDTGPATEPKRTV